MKSAGLRSPRRPITPTSRHRSSLGSARPALRRSSSVCWSLLASLTRSQSPIAGSRESGTYEVVNSKKAISAEVARRRLESRRPNMKSRSSSLVLADHAAPRQVRKWRISDAYWALLRFLDCVNHAAKAGGFTARFPTECNSYTGISVTCILVTSMIPHRTLVRYSGNPDGPKRALSIRQPWTWAILYAGKRVENRSWPTCYRGPIYLHAGMQVDWDSLDDLELVIRRVPGPRPPAYRGALVGTADLVACVRPDEVDPDQVSWAVGPWCFVLENVRALAAPIPMHGARGLFKIKDTM